MFIRRGAWYPGFAGYGYPLAYRYPVSYGGYGGYGYAGPFAGPGLVFPAGQVDPNVAARPTTRPLTTADLSAYASAPITKTSYDPSPVIGKDQYAAYTAYGVTRDALRTKAARGLLDTAKASAVPLAIGAAVGAVAGAVGMHLSMTRGKASRRK